MSANVEETIKIVCQLDVRFEKLKDRQKVVCRHQAYEEDRKSVRQEN